MRKEGTRKILQAILKIVIFAILMLLLYHQLRNGLQRMPEGELYFWQKNFSFVQIIFFILTLVLMPLNWLLELLKWRSLMSAKSRTNFFDTMKAVLAGLTFALFTPNRVGEYGGRVLFVKPEQRLRTVYETVKGSIAQWLAILSGGLIGISSILFSANNEKAVELSYYLLAFALPMFLLMLLLYFRLSRLAPFILRVPLLKRIFSSQLANENFVIRDSILAKSLFWALLRYLVYTLQYLFIVLALGIENELLVSLSAISLIYLLQTGLPLPPVLGLAARGSIAVWIFGIFGNGDFQEQSSILAATFSLWGINLLLPALLGSYFIASKVGFKKKAN
jgi:uncharacterized integral membrane protein